MGENGDVDIVLVHAKASEEEFVKNGFGVERFPVMYNDFIVVGPTEPVEATDDIEAAFTQITEEKLAFISRGDDSGTDKKEKKIWEALKLDPETNENYMESGQGMGAGKLLSWIRKQTKIIWNPVREWARLLQWQMRKKHIVSQTEELI